MHYICFRTDLVETFYPKNQCPMKSIETKKNEIPVFKILDFSCIASLSNR